MMLSEHSMVQCFTSARPSFDALDYARGCVDDVGLVLTREARRGEAMRCEETHALEGWPRNSSVRAGGGVGADGRFRAVEGHYLTV